LFQELSYSETAKNLNLTQLLQTETIGRKLLQKSDKKESLSPCDRAYIVRRIVEKELKCLEKLNRTIRKDVWIQWAVAISQLFKGESSDLYYVPYKVLGGKVIQASGLIHNRLITHRRSLAPQGYKRRWSSNGSGDSDSGHSSSESKRVRPLPDSFNVTSENENNETSLNDQFNWLKNTSSPNDEVIAKWESTLNIRNKLLEKLSYIEYFKTFLALHLPLGYKLVSCILVFFYLSQQAKKLRNLILN
jgi:hypothetical protein